MFEADTPRGRLFDIVLIGAILLSVVVVMLSTLSWAEEHRPVFLGVEWVLTALFTAEYVLRLVIVRKPLRYATSFFGIIDLLSILPAFIGLVIPGSEQLLVVRTLRLLRVFRVFKLGRYLSEATALRQALWDSRQKIAVFLTTVVIVVVITGALMHLVESSAGNDAFASMPEAMYWSIITMTTVGYGDVTPITPLGKAITALLVLVGYSLIIVPTGILSAEMVSTAGRGKPTTQVCPGCLAEGHDRDAVYCKKCGTTLN